MSVAIPTHRIASEAFVQLTRLFTGLKRRGRVVDVIWFQQSADYARAVLDLADECDDEAVREIGTKLRKLLGDYVAPPPTPQPVAHVTAQPAVPRGVEPAADSGALCEADLRYIGRLR